MTANENQKKWIVKDATGRIFGPFQTEQVLEKIDKNYFLGGEMVASYPGGSWIAITKAPEFSDRLLDVLDAEVKGSQKPAVAEAKPAQMAVNEKEKTATVRPKASDFTHSKSADQSISYSQSGLPSLPTTSPGAVIELMDVKRSDRLQRLRKSKIPLLILGGGLCLVAVVLMFSGGALTQDGRIHLLIPRGKQPELSEMQRKEKFVRAQTAFQNDTFNGYQKAENELVEIIEGASKRPEEALKKAQYLSFLCLTYRELWPFARQDAKDLKALSLATQEAKRLDPGGLDSSLCDLVSLSLNGKIADAQGLADSVLRDRGLVAPVLIEMRGDLFLMSKDAQDAIGYFSQARTLWPSWQKTAIQEAKAHSLLGQYPEAMELYHGILKKVPSHGVAKIELGLIEAQQFNQFEKGLSLINAGVDERVPRITEARGYLGIAQIYMKKQQRARALDAAKKAFDLDPTNHEAKELVTNLGGDTKGLQRGETDLMFLGEQYMRGGDFYAAQAQFKAAFDANSKNGIAAMKAGKCLWQLNQTADAIEWLRKAIRADPQLISAYVELADEYAQRYDYFSAVEVLKKAQAIQPSSYEVYRGFATVELRRGNYQGAIAFGNRALKLYETDADSLILMAKANLALQKFSEAQKFAARAIDLDYNNIEAHSLYGKIEAGLHGVAAGANYIQQRLNRYVINQGQQVPQAAIDLRDTLGEIYLADERMQPAEEAYRAAVALDQNSRKSLMGLGKALQGQGQSSAALEQFLKAAVLDPSDPEPIFYSGQLYTETGNSTEAMKQFERVLKINPRYPLAHVEIGRVALKRGDAKKALEESMQERTTNPDLAEAYTLAAEADFNLKNYPGCATEYQKAVAKHIQGATTLICMARCYRLTGALDSAQSLLNQATAVESGNPDIYKEQGAIYHTKGMADAAITAYDTYLRLAPNAADKLEVETRIRRVQSGDLNVGE